MLFLVCCGRQLSGMSRCCGQTYIGTELLRIKLLATAAAATALSIIDWRISQQLQSINQLID